jgi:hypothetical protein
MHGTNVGKERKKERKKNIFVFFLGSHLSLAGSYPGQSSVADHAFRNNVTETISCKHTILTT